MQGVYTEASEYFGGVCFSISSLLISNKPFYFIHLYRFFMGMPCPEYECFITPGSTLC